jgi:hypothetical protein
VLHDVRSHGGAVAHELCGGLRGVDAAELRRRVCRRRAATHAEDAGEEAHLGGKQEAP